MYRSQNNMQSIDFDEALERILKTDLRYDREAYRFVRDALDFTQQQRWKSGERSNRSGRRGHGKVPLRHVSGAELLAGIREYALQQFGPMVTTVLSEWGVHKTDDFGEIVFNMVDARLLNKTAQDRRDDFREVYDFREVFELPFLPSRKVKAPLQLRG